MNGRRRPGHERPDRHAGEDYTDRQLVALGDEATVLAEVDNIVRKQLNLEGAMALIEAGAAEALVVAKLDRLSPG